MQGIFRGISGWIGNSSGALPFTRHSASSPAFMTRQIAIIIPSLSHGGAERVASTLANRWSLQPELVVHLVTFSGLEDFFELDPRVRRINMPLGSRPGPVALLGLALRIRRHLIRQRVSAALSFMDKYNVFVLLALAGSRVRVAVTDRSNPLKRLPAWLRALKRLTYPMAQIVIAQTRQAAGEIRRRTGARHVVVIPNPLASFAAPTSGKRERLVLNVGRLVEEKGQITLIRAFARAGLPDWRLAIIGDGPLRSALEAEAASLDLGGRIELPGVTGDLGPWYSRASIFALSSVSEGYPNALVEAMAHGLPCISSDCDAGPREILTHSLDGILVPTGDEAALADALRSLATQEEEQRRLGARARERVRALSAEEISDRYLQACLGVLDSRTGAVEGAAPSAAAGGAARSTPSPDQTPLTDTPE